MSDEILSVGAAYRMRGPLGVPLLALGQAAPASVPNGGTYTPNLSSGGLHVVTLAGATATIANPINNPPVAGCANLLVLVITNASGGASAITFGTAYDTDMVAPANGDTASVQLLNIGGTWFQLGASNGGGGGGGAITGTSLDITTPLGVELLFKDVLPGGGDNGLQVRLREGVAGADVVYLTNVPSETVEFFQNESEVLLYGADTKTISLLHGDGATRTSLIANDTGIAINAIDPAQVINLTHDDGSGVCVVEVNAGQAKMQTTQAKPIQIVTNDTGAINITGGLGTPLGGNKLIVDSTQVVINIPDTSGAFIEFSNQPSDTVDYFQDETGIYIAAGAGGKRIELNADDGAGSKGRLILVGGASPPAQLFVEGTGVVEIHASGTGAVRIGVAADLLGFFSVASPAAKKTVSGATTDAALISLLAALGDATGYGLIVDNHT